MRFHKFISAVFHPIVMPTVGVILYFIFSPIHIGRPQQYSVLSIVFIATYITPIIILVFLKSIGYINNYQASTIKERKIPVFFMILLFYILGRIFFDIAIVRDIGLLFYGTALGLTIIYFFFFVNIKVSLHILSFGNAIGFFLLLSSNYNMQIGIVILLLILLAGVLASAKLHLKAHTAKEVYLGFFIGIISQVIAFSFL